MYTVRSYGTFSDKFVNFQKEKLQNWVYTIKRLQNTKLKIKRMEKKIVFVDACDDGVQIYFSVLV